MKKHFLLGLAAMLLPWTAWAEAKKGDFIVTGVEETYTYSGLMNLTPTVTAFDEPLTKDDHYTVSYTKDGEPVDNVKDVGHYEMTITGAKGGYTRYESTIVAFEVTKKELKTLKLSATHGEMIYGTNYEDADLSTFVSMDGILDLVAQTKDEYENALKCLRLHRIDTEKGKEVAGNTYKVLVRASEKEETGSNYFYTEGSNVQAVDMMVMPKPLTVEIEGEKEDVYDGDEKTITAKIVEPLYVYEGETDDVSVEIVTTIGTNGENKSLLNADTYTVTVKLTGADANNYTLDNNEIEYVINRAKLEIAYDKADRLEKPYDGKIGFEGDANLTSYYTIKVNGVEVEKFEGLTLELNSEIPGRGINIGSHIVSLLWKGVALSINDFGTPDVEGLTNYTIEYERGSAKNMFYVTPKLVKYYFASEGKEYDGLPVVNDELTYTVEIDPIDGFVGEDSFAALDLEPKAKFDTRYEEVKNVGNYDLVIDGTPLKAFGNYEFELATGNDKNVYKITQAEISIEVKNQTVAFGVIKDGVIPDDVKAKWLASQTGTDIKMSDIKQPQKALDAATIRTMMKIELSEEAAEGKSSGDTPYEDGIILSLLTEDECGDNKDQLQILKNYDIACGTGDLTILGIANLVLNGSEGYVAQSEEGDDTVTEEDAPTEPEKTNIQNLMEFNGAKVDEVVVKDLINYVGIGAAGKAYKPTYEFEEGRFYMLTLPFEVKVRDLSTALNGYAIVNVPDETRTGGNYAYFRLEMKTVPANTLMLFKIDNSITDGFGEMKFEKVTINVPDDIDETGIVMNSYGTDVNFVSVYSKTLIDKEYQDFMLNGVLYRANSSAVNGGAGLDVYPLNGYVSFAPGTGSKARIFVEELDGSTTAISPITGEVINNAAEGWYTIGGMKLEGEPTQKGIYINNGQKVVIK